MPTAPTGPAGPAGATSDESAARTKLCVTNKASRRSVRRGRLVGWTIVVTNCGQHAARAVSVSDYVRTGASLTGRGGGRLLGRRLNWKPGTLAPGAHRTYGIVTRLAPNARLGPYINWARADARNTPPARGRASTRVSSTR